MGIPILKIKVGPKQGPTHFDSILYSFCRFPKTHSNRDIYQFWKFGKHCIRDLVQIYPFALNFKMAAIFLCGNLFVVDLPVYEI